MTDTMTTVAISFYVAAAVAFYVSIQAYCDAKRAAVFSSLQAELTEGIERILTGGPVPSGQPVLLEPGEVVTRRPIAELDPVAALTDEDRAWLSAHGWRP